ncbi:GIY-YIG nuclease family protein [Nonomuraea wenchangensis]
MTLEDRLNDLLWVEKAAADRICADQQQAEHETYLLKCLAADHTSGLVTDAQLDEIFDRYQAVAGHGSMRRWNSLMPVKAELLIARRTNDPQHGPGPDGVWSGTWPLDGQPFPVRGQAVVYVLFDSTNAPCYVGSTGAFLTRLRKHEREGKQFAHWTAHPCKDRETAYQLEDKLLREHKPYLNRKSCR